MLNQMCWLSPIPDAPKQLYLRRSPADHWRPYFAFPECVPDYPVPGGSKGFATYQALRQSGWELLSSDEGERSIKALVDNGFDNAA